MSGELFVFKELLRSLEGKAWGLSLVAVIFLAMLLSSLVLLWLWIQPYGARLIAVPREEISEEQIDQLHKRLLSDPEIAQARYAFGIPGQSQGDLNHFEILVYPGVDLKAVIERLSGWSEFRKVTLPSSGSLGSLRAVVQSPWWPAMTTLSVLLGIALMYWALSLARKSFAGELKLLWLSGAAMRTIQLPFVLLGALYGFAGMLLLELLTYLPGPSNLFGPEEIAQMAVRGFLLGLAFAGVGAILGWLVAHTHTHKYPRPLRRSRMSASSAGVGPR